MNTITMKDVFTFIVNRAIFTESVTKILKARNLPVVDLFEEALKIKSDVVLSHNQNILLKNVAYSCSFKLNVEILLSEKTEREIAVLTTKRREMLTTYIKASSCYTPGSYAGLSNEDTINAILFGMAEVGRSLCMQSLKDLIKY